MGDTTFLVDPMFASPGENPPVPNSPNNRRNPFVPMPAVDLSDDAVVVTHRHSDHFDEAATEGLNGDVPLFCQPEESGAFTEEGFTDVRPVNDEVTFEGVTIHRTPARHGHGELAEDTGPVSGFVFESKKTVYVAGDPITMGTQDIAAVRDATDATVAVVHMEAINHCLLGRDELQSATENVLVPENGMQITV